jgi:hypothetical protein
MVLWINNAKVQKVSELIPLNQKNYQTIQVNDKIIKAGSHQQYLIDDFIPKLGRYEVKKTPERLPFDYTYKVVIEKTDGSTIVLYDNDYIIINQTKYVIVKGTIDLDKFYRIFID